VVFSPHVLEKVMTGGELQVVQDTVRWQCGVCSRGDGKNLIWCLKKTVRNGYTRIVGGVKGSMIKTSESLCGEAAQFNELVQVGPLVMVQVWS